MADAGTRWVQPPSTRPANSRPPGAEYNQGFVQHPALIAQLDLKQAALADLTDPQILSGLAVPDDIHHCEWRMLLDAGKVPPTHHLRQRLIADGF